MLEKKPSILTLIPLFLVIVIDTMGVGLILPIISPLFMQHNGGLLPAGASETVRNYLYSIALGGFAVFMFFGAPLLGDLSDSWGRKKVLVFCLIATGLTLVVAALGVWWHSAALLIIGRCLSGFVAGSQPIAQAAIADISTPENKATNLGYMVFASCLGFVIGPIIGGYFANSNLVSWFTPATPFFVAAILALLNAWLLSVSFTDKFIPKIKKELQLSKAVMVFVAAFTHKKIRLLSAMFLLMEMGFSIYFVYVSLYLVQAFNYNSTEIGHFMAYMGLCWAITFIAIIPWVAKHFSLRQMALSGLVVMALSFLFSVTHSELLLWACVIPLAVFNGITYSAILAMYSNSVDQASQGWVMGVSAAVNAAAWAIGSLLSGVLGSVHLDAPFIGAAVMTFLSFVLFIMNRVKASD